jgi:hypothetical protein
MIPMCGAMPNPIAVIAVLDHHAVDANETIAANAATYAA